MGFRGINGTVGVDVFFALSGYVITTLLLRESAKSGQNCITRFYIRRLFRIVPLYLLAIAFYLSAWIERPLIRLERSLAEARAERLADRGEVQQGVA